MKTKILLIVAILFATSIKAQWVVTPSSPVSAYAQQKWDVDADLNERFMVITYGNQTPSTTPGSPGTFLKVFDSNSAAITGDIAVFSEGQRTSRVKLSSANIVYVLGVESNNLMIKRYNTSGVLLGSHLIKSSIGGIMYDLAITDNNDVLVSLFEGDKLIIRSYSGNIVLKGAINVANSVTHFHLPSANLRAQFMDFNDGHVLIGYSRGLDPSLTSTIKKYNYNAASPSASVNVDTHHFKGGFTRSDFGSLNSHQVALRANGDVFYINGLSGVNRISGGSTQLINARTKSKVNVDANDNVLISWTDMSSARALLYAVNNTLTKSYMEDGNINGMWAPAFYNCKFVLAGDKSNQATDFHTFRKAHYQVFNCSDCMVGGEPTASAKFRFPNQMLEMDSKYGPVEVAELCLVDNLWVDGSASCNETGYFIELAEFDLINWTDINVLHSAWVCTGCQVPNNIDITDFLPQGYQLRPDKVYRFRLAVGPVWDATDIFFKIACCKRDIIGVPWEDVRTERSKEYEKENDETEDSADINELEVSIYPNPAKDQVTLDMSKVEKQTDIRISIKDINGKEVYRKRGNSAELMNLSIGDWENGIYICTIESAKGKSIQRIIKN